ncbi:class B sortase [Butyrivibrio sp. AE2032]|uniref:class B sortase n=1 Tax=Butyrivibrio sp. AE2032 TaxID=1458463 RepID=UPI00163AD4DB|nr:class B sortase [Butyrivibrio sp. AE2032]
MFDKNPIDRCKGDLITKLMLGVRGFNQKHRQCAKVATFFALFLIVIISALFGIAGGIWSLVRLLISDKRKIGIALAVVLILGTTVMQLAGPTARAVDTMPLPEYTQAAEVQEEAMAEATVCQMVQEEAAMKEASAEVAAQPEVSRKATKEWNTLDVDLSSFAKDYPETVGWVYFGDGHISYPIMQGEDNSKYRVLGYDGEEARTGAVFLDYRSSADFSDSNSIIYGHNMKDRSMFGSLRDYREDPRYYDTHQYFQIITPEKSYRYLIFAYMDVPENYVIYDYVGDASKVFVEDAEPVRRKSYMDSEIPVNESKKVVTLSTCTDKDELQFVVLGVMVDED